MYKQCVAMSRKCRILKPIWQKSKHIDAETANDKFSTNHPSFVFSALKTNFYFIWNFPKANQEAIKSHYFKFSIKNG